MSAAPGFAELHCLSPFSFQRAASHARELFDRAKELGYSALAITDECSRAGIVRTHEAARDTGVKLIVGCEAQVEDGPKLVMLAPDLAAYASMSGLISHARRRSGACRSATIDLTLAVSVALIAVLLAQRNVRGRARRVLTWASG